MGKDGTLVIEMDVLTGQWQMVTPQWFSLDDMAKLASAMEALKAFAQGFQVQLVR